MATIHYSNESSTIDALWVLLSQQTENVKRVLAERLNDSLSSENKNYNKVVDEALSIAKSLSETSERPDHKSDYKRYSKRLNRLRSLCGNNIPAEDLQTDERLNYLLSK